MSFLARVSYTSTGSTDTFSFSFPYILSSHVKVYVDGVEDTGITFPTTSTVQLSSTPANGAVVLIQRITPSDARLVDFQDGSVLTSADLDQSADQNFYLAQETTDNVASKLGLDASDRYDAGNKRIINVANPVDNTDAVNKQFISTNLPNITTVAGISSNVTTVAGISANVTSVANNEADIDLVALNMPSVTTVANNIADVVTVANDLNEAISEIETTANDLNEAVSEIDVVGTNIASVQTVGTNIGDVNTVASANADIQTLADLEDGTVTTNGLSTLAGLNTEIQGVYNIRTNVTNVDTNATNVNLVAGQISPTNNISAVGAVASQISTLGALGTEITNLNNIRTDITGVNNIAGDVTAVNNNSANINTVAGLNTEITALGASGTVASINTVANNINSVNSFANTYLGASATAPTLDPDGSALDLGDLYFDTVSDTMKVYSSGGWINAGSAVNGTANRFKYTATASQTTFTGADDNSNTLAYDAGFIDVYLNGIRLVNGSDFTATSGTSIVLTTGASVNDILEIVAFGTFSLSNFSITDANDVPVLGSAGQALVVNSGGTALEFSTPTSSINDLSDTPASLGSAGQALVVNQAGTALEYSNSSSAEIYGFVLTDTDSDGVDDTLQVTTTNGGADNISATTYASFDDVIYASTGFSWSLDSNGHLIATI